MNKYLSITFGFLLLITAWLFSMSPDLLPTGLNPTALRMAGITALVAVLWLTNAMPIGATSLIPLFLMPLAEILPAKKVAPAYGSNIILLFLCGFFIAKTIERWGLHRRISLNIIKTIGTSPKRLILGFMVATASLSAWISNTATCLMMLPIAIAAIDQFKLIEQDKNKVTNFATCLMLGIAFSANIGGLTTPIASSSNIIFLANFNEFFPDRTPVSFGQWVMVSLPLVVVFLALTWAYLVNFSKVKLDNQTTHKEDLAPEANFVMVGAREEILTAKQIQPTPTESAPTSTKMIIDNEIKKLGPMSLAEKQVAVLFAVTAVLWIFLGDLTIGSFTIPGWSSFLGLESFVKNTTVAAAIAFVMFLIPARTKQGKQTQLLDWGTANTVPWDILLLFGAGVAISKGFTESGLSQFLTDNLAIVLKVTPFIATIVIVSIFTAVLTEFASNTACALLMMPICAALAPAIGFDPLILMWTATKSLKCTFCLPVATPPNAIVYSQKYFSIATMTKVGLILNAIGVILIALTINFLAVPIMN